MIKNECGHAYKLLDHAECLWCENCVEKLVKRLSKKPEVTEEWIEEKAKGLSESSLYHGIDGERMFSIEQGEAKDFIRSLIEEIAK